MCRQYFESKQLEKDIDLQRKQVEYEEAVFKQRAFNRKIESDRNEEFAKSS
jgi:hypothetical protein